MANRRSRDYDEDDDDDYEDRPRRRGPERDAGPSPVLLLGILGGALAVVVVVIILVVHNRRAQREEEQEVARQHAVIAQEEDRQQAEIVNGFRGDNGEAGGDNRVPLPKPGGGGGIEHNDNPPPNPEPDLEPQPNTPVPPLPAGFRENRAQGPAGARKRFREFRQKGTALVGFEVGCGSVDGKRVVSYLRPIYRSPEGQEELGAVYGHSSEEHVTVKAKEGYAVGEIAFAWSATRCIDTIRLTFMKIVPDGLDPAEWSVSDWYGSRAGKQDPAEAQRDAPKVVPLVVGIHGYRYEDTGGDEPRQSGAIARLGLVAVPNKATDDALATVVPNPPDIPGLGRPELPVPRPLPAGWQQSKTLGSGANDAEYSEFRTDGSLLVGFEVGNDLLYVRPIWLTPGGVEEFGTAYGKKSDAVTTLKAREGYAVSGIIAPNASSRLDLFALTFAKQIPRKGLSTNKKDMYTSEWVGDVASKDRAETVSALGGFPVVGIHGRRDAVAGDMRSIGLIVPNKPDGWQIVAQPLDKLPAFKPERIKLAGTDGRLDSFDDAAPAGGWLVGIEAHVVKWENSEVIGSVRPMFMTGNKPSDGTTHGKAGNASDKVVRVAARPGYAIGAMNVKAGTDVYGFSVTFMKVTGGKLNPKDSYQSEWVGSNPDTPETALKGEGRPIVGLCGRALGADKPVFAIGLLAAPADGK
jgi:hypothetical protein